MLWYQKTITGTAEEISKPRGGNDSLDKNSKRVTFNTPQGQEHEKQKKKKHRALVSFTQTHRVESWEEADGRGCVQRDREELLHAHGVLDRRQGWTHQSGQEAILTCVTWREGGSERQREEEETPDGPESSLSPCHRQRHHSPRVLLVIIPAV